MVEGGCEVQMEETFNRQKKSTMFKIYIYIYI